MVEDRLVPGEALEAHDLLGEERAVVAKLNVPLAREVAEALVEGHGDRITARLTRKRNDCSAMAMSSAESRISSQNRPAERFPKSDVGSVVRRENRSEPPHPVEEERHRITREIEQREIGEAVFGLTKAHLGPREELPEAGNDLDIYDIRSGKPALVPNAPSGPRPTLTGVDAVVDRRRSVEDDQ